MSDAQPQHIRATFGVHGHLLSATVDCGGRSLLDVVRGADEECLRLREAQIREAGEAGHAVYLPDFWVKKREIVLMLGSSSLAEPSLSPADTGERRCRPAFLMLPGYSVTGWLNSSVAAEPAAMLAREAKGFLSLSEATVRRSVGRGAPSEVEVALVNMAFVSACSIGEELSGFPSASATATTSYGALDSTDAGRIYNEIHDLIDDMDSVNERPTGNSLWFPDFASVNVSTT